LTRVPQLTGTPWARALDQIVSSDTMSEDDRQHWDELYAQGGIVPVGDHGPPPAFVSARHLFPSEGLALDIACGRGRASVWLAMRGMDVLGVDVSSIAIDLARELTSLSGVADRCRFVVHDLDQGLPESPQMDLVLCHKFRDPHLDLALMDRLAPEGLLAVATLSEVDAEPGRFRVRPGELREAFGPLEVLAEGEADGIAWLIGRK
jgi:2-polyprenyl-3-methyl-5-hydroxy-6-metoxy-1,4-benzoquinol methylase